MDQIQAQKQLAEIVHTLPERLRTVALSTELSGTTRIIGEKNGLSLEQINLLSWQTLYVIVGILPPQEFISTLIGTLKIPLEKARIVGQEINERIFRPIKDDLKSLYGISVPESAPGGRKSIDEELEEKAGVRKTGNILSGGPQTKNLNETTTNTNAQPLLPNIQKTETARVEIGNPVSAPTSPQNTSFTQSKPMMIKTFAKDLAEAEEALTKEKILKEIENPSSIKSKPPQPPTPRPYTVDPYREPIN